MKRKAMSQVPPLERIRSCRDRRQQRSCAPLDSRGWLSLRISFPQSTTVRCFLRVMFGSVFLALNLFLLTPPVHAQDNYEIQVYDSEATPKNVTMVEIHSNFTVDGSKQAINGVLPSNHAEHETLEITQGWTDWFETGFYVFTSIQPGGQGGGGWNWVGDHIRPRFTAPESWHLPVGVSISQEIGYQRRKFAEDSWNYELRPIIDKRLGRWYFDFNPAFDRALHGLNTGRGWEFSPNVKVSFDFTKKITGGFEYYGVSAGLKLRSHFAAVAADLSCD